MLAPEREYLLAVEGRLSAFPDRDDLAVTAILAAGILSARREGLRERDVVDPAAGSQQAERAFVIRLPQSTRVRRQGIAADLDLVANDPGGEDRDADDEDEGNRRRTRASWASR